jgi:hypothetical protein
MGKVCCGASRGQRTLEILGTSDLSVAAVARVVGAQPDAVILHVGAPESFDLASRLEGANNAYEPRILVDQDTFQLAQHDVEGREIHFLTVLGRVEPVRVYEIMAPAGGLSAAESELRGLFAEGLAAYRARDWDRSDQCFAQCLR